MTAPGQADEYTLTEREALIAMLGGGWDYSRVLDIGVLADGILDSEWLAARDRAVREAALEEVALKIDAMEEAHRDDDRSYLNGLSDASRIVRRAAANQTGESNANWEVLDADQS